MTTGIGYDLELLRTALRGVGGDASTETPRFRDFHVLATCESTNAEAARLARRSGHDGTVVLANAQTGGRGRLGRTWESPAGLGLYISIVLRAPGLETRLSVLPLLVGLSVAEAAVAAGVPGVDVKWPNDVRVAGRKLCGVLCEWVAPSASGVPAVVAGIGVNVNQLVADFPKELREQATSVRLALGRRVAREEVLAAILGRVHANLAALTGPEGFPWERWRALSVVEGRRVAVSTPGGAPHEGTVVRVDPDGALVLRDDDGAEARVLAGDVTVAAIGPRSPAEG